MDTALKVMMAGNQNQMDKNYDGLGIVSSNNRFMQFKATCKNGGGGGRGRYATTRFSNLTMSAADSSNQKNGSNEVTKTHVKMKNSAANQFFDYREPGPWRSGGYQRPYSSYWGGARPPFKNLKCQNSNSPEISLSPQ